MPQIYIYRPDLSLISRFPSFLTLSLACSRHFSYPCESTRSRINNFVLNRGRTAERQEKDREALGSANLKSYRSIIYATTIFNIVDA